MKLGSLLILFFNALAIPKAYSEITSPHKVFNYSVEAIYLIVVPNSNGGISWGYSYEGACKMLGDDYFWGIVPSKSVSPACYTLPSLNMIIGTDSWFCADGSISYFNTPAHFCSDTFECPDGSWVLSTDKSICEREDLPCIPDPQNVSEEQLLAAIAYGESHWSNIYEEMAAIASATLRSKEAKHYKTINELVKKSPNFSYVTSHPDDPKRRNERYYNVMCSIDSKGVDLAYKAAQNALNHGIDYSNGACFWDGLDLKAKGTQAYRYLQGFKISQKEHNVLGVDEPPLLNKKGAKGKIYNFTYVSTAGIGKSIFWKLSDDFLVAWGGKQCI
ncbi:TPA: hypothetical protein RJD65_001158 [Legionella pneumophila]|nr:hypothetical protein [Legionella pneumophila]